MTQRNATQRNATHCNAMQRNAEKSALCLRMHERTILWFWYPVLMKFMSQIHRCLWFISFRIYYHNFIIIFIALFLISAYIRQPNVWRNSIWRRRFEELFAFYSVFLGSRGTFLWNPLAFNLSARIHPCFILNSSSPDFFNIFLFPVSCDLKQDALRKGTRGLVTWQAN